MTDHVEIPENDNDGPAATGSQIEVKNKEGKSISLPEYTDKLSFTVPKDAPQTELRGTKIEKPYNFGRVSSDAQASEVMAIKGWNLADFVNEALQSASRSGAYQTTLALYRPSKVAEEDIVERMVRDYIRLGIPEEAARAQVTSMLSNK